jgi:outer membrane protein OmpU
MKKILLATTLLAASAGFAAAEVAVSGSARMGVFSTGVAGADAQFSSRVRINFSATGETDGGLTFGASTRADQSAGNSTDTGTTNGSSTVFISGAFGKLTMGDTGNAADALVGQVSGIGYGPGALDGAADVSFLGGNTATGVSYEYSAGAVTFALGTGQVGNATGYMSAAVKYSTDAYSVALGYEDSSAGNVLSVLGSATFSGATVKAKVADAAAGTAFALSVDYTMNGVGVTAFYADNNAVDANYGIGASYDLGGGASVKGGVGSVGGNTAFDLGVAMSF